MYFSAIDVPRLRAGIRLRSPCIRRLWCEREPIELCFDARDQCAACGQPIIAPANHREEPIDPLEIAKNTHDLDALPQLEESAPVGALRVVHAIGHDLSQRR